MNKGEISKEKLLWIYETMVKIRIHEERVAELFAENKIPGFVHLYVGEEAVATGVVASLKKEDFISSTHRGHGHYIAKGGDIKASMAELFGRTTGCCKGKGGSMHIVDFSIGELGANGIVGGGIPHAVGAAMGIKLNGLDDVAVAFFGDGASNQQNFHEGINLAAILKLPVVFVCENNGYQISLPYSKQQIINSVAERGKSYGIPAVSVDGQDVMAVYELAKEAIERARNGEGPSLIEAKTYRFRGHFEGDPVVYRTKEESEWWKENKDPIVIFKELLLKKNMFSEDDFALIQKKKEEEIEEAVKFAEGSPWPKKEDVFKDVFSTSTKGVLVWEW
jgi:acetoin:2,6-dichlorophenolindophenol oxidoreductase subunit alpha